MLDIAPSELLLVAFVALVVIGPKDLPKAMRVVGYWVGRARGVARQFRSGFDTMVREAELEEMEKRWKEENERIMREHPAEPPAESPIAEPSPAASETPSDVEPVVTSEDKPVMTSQPQMFGGLHHGDDTVPADDPAPMLDLPMPEPAPSGRTKP